MSKPKCCKCGSFNLTEMSEDELKKQNPPIYTNFENRYPEASRAAIYRCSDCKEFTEWVEYPSSFSKTKTTVSAI